MIKYLAKGDIKMFEQRKLNKYAQSLVGFAYEMSSSDSDIYNVRIYLVIDNPDSYSFVYYKK